MSGCQSGETAELAQNGHHLPRRLRAIQWSLLVLFGVVSFSLAASGYRYWRQQASAIRASRYDELKAIGELKANQIVAWRRERLGDARMISEGPFIKQSICQWLKAQTDALRSDIVARLQLVQKNEGYENVMLAAPDGRLLLSLNPRVTELEAQARQLAAQAVSSRAVVFGDFFRCSACNQVHLDVAAPISDAEDRPVAAIILRTDPEQHLWPLIQSWPTPSRSAETLLMRRDGEDALFLNQLRHVPDPPLTPRVPLSRTDIPAVRAAMGETGEFQGHDYRGIAVLGDIRAVPDSPWFMVAKVDTDEILPEARYRGYVVLLLVGLSILTSSF